MSPATYGSLFEQAARAMDEGRRQVQFAKFETKDQAEDAVSAYYGLLEAAREHVWALITPARVAGVVQSEHRHPVENSAVWMANSMPTGPDDVRPHVSLIAPARHPWDEAARYLRAGADLLGTHTTATGVARTPDAWVVWDEVARHAALGRLGGLVASLSAAQDALALRVGQAGVRWERVGRWLPGGRRVNETALAVVRAADLVGASSADLDELAPANLAVRRVDPVAELDDRIGRLRRRAWNLRTEPDYSVRTLADLAQAGFVVAAQTAVFHGTDLHDKHAVVRSPYAKRAAAWLALMGDLRGYLGAGPGDGRVHADVAAVHDLLSSLVPRDRTGADRGVSPDPGERHLGGTLHGACASLARTAEWNAATFARLAHSGHVYVRLDDLHRDLVSERPDLAAAKLTRRGITLTPAPLELTERTLDRYRDVVAVRTEPTNLSPSPVVRRTLDASPVLTRDLPDAS